MKRIGLLLVAGVALTAGCGQTGLKAPAPRASDTNSVAAIQNDPNMSPDVKARLIAQMQGGAGSANKALGGSGKITAP